MGFRLASATSKKNLKQISLRNKSLMASPSGAFTILLSNSFRQPPLSKRLVFQNLFLSLLIRTSGKRHE